MRLLQREINILKSTILNHIPDGKISLFGSRVYDNKKGGDISIFIETQQNVSTKEELKILSEIELKGISRQKQSTD